MTLLQFLLLSRRLTRWSVADIAASLSVSADHLSAVLWGRRPASPALYRRASRIFHLSAEALAGRITERDVQEMVRRKWVSHGASGGAREVVPQ